MRRENYVAVSFLAESAYEHFGTPNPLVAKVFNKDVADAQGFSVKLAAAYQCLHVLKRAK